MKGHLRSFKLLSVDEPPTPVFHQSWNWLKNNHLLPNSQNEMTRAALKYQAQFGLWTRAVGSDPRNHFPGYPDQPAAELAWWEATLDNVSAANAGISLGPAAPAARRGPGVVKNLPSAWDADYRRSCAVLEYCLAPRQWRIGPRSQPVRSDSSSIRSVPAPMAA